MTRSIARPPKSRGGGESGPRFVQGNPVSLNGEMLDPVSLVRRANDLLGSHGFGRLDIIENPGGGHQVEEIYELPACFAV